MNRRRVAVLSASGLVGQTFQTRLVEHPWFELTAVVGSPDTAGRQLGEIEWRLDEQRPALPDLQVLDLSTDSLVDHLHDAGVSVVFSALPSEVASRVEPVLVDAGLAVFSNASSFRGAEGIPLVVADLNPHHLKHLDSHACSTNCTVIPVALPLKPVWDMVGIQKVSMTTEQALSGAGWRLLADEAALKGKVNPEIPGEAEKVARELLHLLGRVEEDRIRPADFNVEVSCSRVAERHGHLVRVEAILSRETTRTEVMEWMSSWSDRPQHLDLPSAPTTPLVIIEGTPDRSLHLMSGGDGLRAGMGVVVGDLRVEGRILSFTALSHNVIRGAAGGCMLLAELVLAEGLLNDHIR